MQYTSVGVFLG